MSFFSLGHTGSSTEHNKIINNKIKTKSVRVFYRFLKYNIKDCIK